MDQSELTGGYLFDVQGFSVHDGPGCRTLIFLKGCTLHCDWCSNPEGISPFPQPLLNPSKCISDHLCIEACSKNAIRIHADSLVINRSECDSCSTYVCAKACCSSAIRIAGYCTTIDDLLRKIERDRHYWGSGGGITLTGGEPFLQAEFTEELLKRCYDAYIHTAVETCGNVAWNNIERSLQYLDWIFFDLKQMVSARHRKATGSGNELILENARKLAGNFDGRLVFRLPLIPGFNDGDEHIAQIAEFLHKIGKNEINVLPVHHLGREKYTLLGSGYYTSDFTGPSRELIEKVRQSFLQSGITCYLGSDTPF